MKFHSKILMYLTGILLSASASYSQELWQVIGNMPLPVEGAEAVLFNNKIYILGGYSDSTQDYIDWIQLYDPRNGTWELAGNMNHSKYKFAAGLYDEKIYYIGGDACSNPADTYYSYLEYWDPVLNETSAPMFIENLFVISTSSGFVDGNEMLVCGTIFFNNQLTSLVKINIDTQEVVLDIPNYTGYFDLYFDSMVANINDNIYLFGGADFGMSDRIYVLDEISEELVELPVSLNVPRAGGCAITNTANDNIYIIAGYTESSSASNIVETFYSIYNNYNVSSISSIINGRRYPAAVIHGEKIYVFGGMKSSGYVESSIETLEIVSNINNNAPVFDNYQLYQNYPNPFNPGTTIGFRLKSQSNILLIVYNSNGEEVITLADEELSAGIHNFYWDGLNNLGEKVSSGIYFYELSGSDFKQTRKMILLR